MKKVTLGSLLIISIILASNASAEWFNKSGKINTVLVEDVNYAGCMIFMDTPVGHGCLSNWISLDCKGLFNSKDRISGAQKLASAMSALKSGKQVTIYNINSNYKANGYCVARRIDVHF